MCARMSQQECLPAVSYKLIFLDVDGVLNNRHIPHEISLCILNRLGKLVKATGASIVLSSTWRLKEKNREHVKAMFLHCGLPMPISVTPFIETRSYKTTRVDEILTWLFLNSTNWCQDEEKFNMIITERDEFTAMHFILPLSIHVSHFVVLDDIDLTKEKYGGPYRRLLTDNHFVHTAISSGFSRNNAHQAARLLDAVYKNAEPPKYCEHCHVLNARGHDQEINMYFCAVACQEEFYSLAGKG
jgi:hypothetical protein